jgi:hypothetical protein
MNISKITRDIYSLRYSDMSLRKSVEKHIDNVFYDNTINFEKGDNLNAEKNVSSEEKVRCLKKGFQSRGGFGLPSIDSALQSRISKALPKSVASRIEIPTREEVSISTAATVKRYTTKSKLYGGVSSLHLYVWAGQQALSHLGVWKSVHGLTSTQDSVNHTSKNSNSGPPLYGRKNSEVCLADTLAWLTSIREKPNAYGLFKNPLMENPEIIFYRFQAICYEIESLIRFKIREVWCVPQRIIALENVYFRTILDKVKQVNATSAHPVYSSGLSNYQISQKIVSRVRRRQNARTGIHVYSLDYSKYDSTVPDYAIDIFFKLIETRLLLSDKDKKLFDLLRYYTKHSPFIYENKVIIQERGISSGSLITNLFDTWWNLTLWYASCNIRNSGAAFEQYVASGGRNVAGSFLYDKEFSTKLIEGIGLCGDDVIYATDELTIKIHRTLCKEIGMIVTTNMVTRDIRGDTFFLGRYWNNRNEPFQTEFYMTSHIICRSSYYRKEELNFDISEDLSFNRIFSILFPLSNGKNYFDKVFQNWGEMNSFLVKNKGFYLLKDNIDKEGYKFVKLQSIVDWTKL